LETGFSNFFSSVNQFDSCLKLSEFQFETFYFETNLRESCVRGLSLIFRFGSKPQDCGCRDLCKFRRIHYGLAKNACFQCSKSRTDTHSKWSAFSSSNWREDRQQILDSIIEFGKLLPETQFGFKRNKSITDVLITLEITQRGTYTRVKYTTTTPPNQGRQNQFIRAMAFKGGSKGGAIAHPRNSFW
jgi:hypothetical protein